MGFVVYDMLTDGQTDQKVRRRSSFRPVHGHKFLTVMGAGNV